MNKEKAIEKWKRVPIKDIYLDLYDGPHATPKPSSEGPIFLGIKNITEDGKLDLSEIRYIAEEDFSNWTKRVTPRPDDIVFTYEATLNRYAIIPRNFRGCLGRRIALIRPNPAKINSRFLFYFFFSDDWRTTISKNILSGSTVDRIPLISFPSFKIFVPPLLTQHKIAAILSAYDDLIENNTRRIAILEEMAQTIYQEWFVHFRYPGYDENEMVESELGVIPEGWKVVTFRDVSKLINRGISPKYDETSDSIVINQRCIRDRKLNLEVVRTHCTHVPNTKLVKFGDVLINSTGVGTLGRMTQVYQDIPNCTVDSHVTIVRPENNVTIDYFGHYALDYQSYFARSGVGSTGQTELSRESIANTIFLMPPIELQQAFTNIVSPLRKNIINLLKKNNVLIRTRDLLLPKLISGEIDVEALNIEIPDIIEPEERQEPPLMASSEPMDATQLALPLLQC